MIVGRVERRGEGSSAIIQIVGLAEDGVVDILKEDDALLAPLPARLRRLPIFMLYLPRVTTM